MKPGRPTVAGSDPASHGVYGLYIVHNKQWSYIMSYMNENVYTHCKVLVFGCTETIVQPKTRTRGSAAGCARRPNPCLLAKTVGSGIFQFSYHLIAISANAGCMDLGFIVGGQRKNPCQARKLSSVTAHGQVYFKFALGIFFFGGLFPSFLGRKPTKIFGQTRTGTNDLNLCFDVHLTCL